MIDPGSGEQHELDLRYLHTEAEGETFESLRANLDAVASQTGMGDIFRSAAPTCTGRALARIGAAAPARRGQRRPPGAGRAACAPPRGVRPYQEVARVALEALDDQLGLGHTLLFAHDVRPRGLFAVASAGYAHPRSARRSRSATG